MHGEGSAKVNWLRNTYFNIERDFELCQIIDAIIILFAVSLHVLDVRILLLSPSG